jgi:hypothetical protein
MFRSTGAPLPLEVVEVPADLIPISHLELDLPTPVETWNVYPAARDIEVTLDDIGRMSISRDDARMLLGEKREREAKCRAKAAEAERAAIEADQLRRSQLWGGIPADHMPPGVAPAAVMLQVSRDARPKRTSVLQEALAGSETLTYHPLPKSDEAS